MSEAASPSSPESARANVARAARTAHEELDALSLPVVGEVDLPPADQLAFLAGVGVLAAIEVIEWPVAIVLALGHALASSHRNRLVREFGEAIESA